MLDRIARLCATRPELRDLAQAVVALLRSSFPHYHWVGIYEVEGDSLVLRAWVGPAATEHTRIAVGQGLCGAAVAGDRTIVVDDVREDSRYLACFPATRSEIVVPVRHGGRVLGEIDVDSDHPAAFGEADRRFLERAAELLAAAWARERSGGGPPGVTLSERKDATMTAEALQQLFRLNAYAIRVNTEGLSHTDSLIQPGNSGNCANWVLGHILASRNRVLELLGEEPVFGAAAARYERGSAPLVEAREAQPFEELQEVFERTEEPLQAGLARLSEDDLAAPVGKETKGERLALLQFHEAYHAGQLGLLRRIAGKPGAIA